LVKQVQASVRDERIHEQANDCCGDNDQRLGRAMHDVAPKLNHARRAIDGAQATPHRSQRAYDGEWHVIRVVPRTEEGTATIEASPATTEAGTTTNEQ
jgi:hypothetical protein